MVSIRLYWLWLVRHFLNCPAPINLGNQISRLKAERDGNIIKLCQINPQQAAFNFCDGIAGGVMPARKLQLVSKHILRPTALVTPSADQPPDEIPLLHFPTSNFISLRRLTVSE
jgi:hypothetical protein